MDSLIIDTLPMKLVRLLYNMIRLTWTGKLMVWSF